MYAGCFVWTTNSDFPLRGERSERAPTPWHRAKMLVYCLVPALLDEPVAQAVEQRTFNARVESSSLSRLTHQVAC